MGETYPFLYIEIKQQSPLQNSAMSYNKRIKEGTMGKNDKIEGTHVILNAVKNSMKDIYNNSFDELIFDIYFNEINVNFDISRIRTDAYGDGGVDYLFFTVNKKILLTEDDISEIEDKDIIDIHFLQMKQSHKIDSNVPNKLIELSENFFNGKNISHYNQEIKDNIDLFNKISDKILPKGKFNLNFYYFGYFDKYQLKAATDLWKRFDTLKAKTQDLDYISKTNISIKSISDIYIELSKGHKFEYSFKKIEKYFAEVNEITDETDAVIALVPIKQYYDFITCIPEIYNEGGTTPNFSNRILCLSVISPRIRPWLGASNSSITSSSSSNPCNVHLSNRPASCIFFLT